MAIQGSRLEDLLDTFGISSEPRFLNYWRGAQEAWDIAGQTCELTSPFLPHVLGLKVLHTVLHGLQLRLQASFVIDQGIQLLPEGTEVGLKEGIQVFGGCGGCLLLEEVPLGFQDLILLL